MSVSGAPRALVVLLVVSVAACSGASGPDPDQADPVADAEDLIEGSLADQIALGPLTADCTSEETQGQPVIVCTGTTEDGRVVGFESEITDEGAGPIASTNAVTPGQIGELEASAVLELNEQNGTELPMDAMQCEDDRALILEPGAVLECEVADPQSGETVAAVLTITNPEGPVFDVELAPAG
jgi:hypothetical protein